MAKEMHILAGVRTDSQSIAKALRKKPRISEFVIQSFLFLCGALTILTTIGIVYELGKESLNFFLKVQWEEINKNLAEPLAANENLLFVTARGSAIAAG